MLGKVLLQRLKRMLDISVAQAPRGLPPARPDVLLGRLGHLWAGPRPRLPAGPGGLRCLDGKLQG